MNGFSGRAASVVGPALSFEAVTPDDAVDLPGGATRGLYVGSAGVLTVMDQSGGVAAFTSGDTQYHPISVRRVLATGTTASGIVALY